MTLRTLSWSRCGAVSRDRRGRQRPGVAPSCQTRGDCPRAGRAERRGTVLFRVPERFRSTVPGVLHGTTRQQQYFGLQHTESVVVDAIEAAAR